ncbi:MAG TPA: hypothetical protein VD947_01560 [Patescibacteria group bacterium]|nr:hypothetical protein [Patescibacteria group bacterium]
MARKITKKNSLIIAATVLSAVIIAVIVLSVTVFREEAAAPQHLSEPESTAQYKDGQTIEMTGEVVCLPHRDQSGPVTMECAFGFLDSENDKYYALRDRDGTDPARIAGLQTKEILKIKGIYKNNADQKYQQEGTIELISIEE